MSAVQKVENQQSQVATAGQQAPNDASALMTIIERISGMPDLDLDRVERLFDMHQKMIDRQQEQAFNNAMARAQSEIQSVVVNQTNKHTGSSYADIDAIHQEAKPVWTSRGFSVLTRTGKSDLQGHVKVYCEVRHSGGHKECYEDDWPLDVSGSQGKANKTAIQGKGSTITYARRYTELMIFDIAIKGEDKDGNRQPAALPDISGALAAINNAGSMDLLHKVFSEAWNTFGQKELRQQLSAAKDARKKELSNA